MINTWITCGEGQAWVPALNTAELRYEIPTNLLARIAFQESSFRQGVILGFVPSKAGALGIMQLMPQFFASVRVPVPFTDADVASQIDESVQLLRRQYDRFGDWQEAVAAYNWGGGNEHHSYVEHGSYILADMPPQTQNYVKEVFADVPVAGALLPDA
jgi:soluble lytic murein transglycosylase-like protein